MVGYSTRSVDTPRLSEKPVRTLLQESGPEAAA